MGPRCIRVGTGGMALSCDVDADNDVVRIDALDGGKSVVIHCLGDTALARAGSRRRPATVWMIGYVGGDARVLVMESIATHLAGLDTGLARARQETAAADHAVQQIAARAAASGFVGIAQNTGRVREAIRQIHGAIGIVAERVGEANSALAAAPKQTTPQETIRVLEPLIARVEAIHTAIGGVVESVTRAQQVTGAVLQGGQPGPMLARLSAIRETMLAVTQRNAMAKQQAQAAIVEAQKTGDQGN